MSFDSVSKKIYHHSDWLEVSLSFMEPQHIHFYDLFDNFCIVRLENHTHINLLVGLSHPGLEEIFAPDGVTGSDIIS